MCTLLKHRTSDVALSAFDVVGMLMQGITLSAVQRRGCRKSVILELCWRLSLFAVELQPTEQVVLGQC